MNQNNTNTELAETWERKAEQAAAPCPEEFRPAYIHLLEELHADNIEIIEGNGIDCPTPVEDFYLTVLNVLVNYPNVDPWNFAEIVDHHPDGAKLAEQLRVLSRLRHRERV